jgi:transglutaminase-like putative cysteine protease
MPDRYIPRPEPSLPAGSLPARMMAGRRWLIAATAVLAVTPFAPAFADAGYLLFTAGAVVVVVLASGVSSPRWPFVVSVFIAVAACAAFEVWIVIRVGIPSTGTPELVWETVTGSWRTMLSAPAPSPSRPGLVSLPVVVGAATAFASAELAARTRWPSIVPAPILAAFATALLFSGRHAVRLPILAAFVFGLVALIWPPESAAFGWPKPRRQIASVAAVMAVGLVIVTALAGRQVVPGADEDRFDIREDYRPPIDMTPRLSPLGLVASGLANPANPVVFRVKLDGPSSMAIDRVRIASLDTYDGAVWSTSATVEGIGDELPRRQRLPSTGSKVDGESVSQTYTITDAYPSPYVPALDEVVSINSPTRDDLSYDRITGMVSFADTPRPSTYHVASVVPRIDESRAQQAKAASEPSASPLTRLPDEPMLLAELRAYLAKLDRGAGLYDTLRLITDDLRSDRFGYHPEAASGHGLGRLARFVSDPAGGTPDSTSRVGTSEQAAALLAVLARMLHAPSRVVVGYRLPNRTVEPAQEVEVRADAIHAWAEVHLDGVGWMPFDPTNPTPRTPVDEQVPRPRGPATTTTTMMSAQPSPPVAPPTTVPTVTGQTCGPADLLCGAASGEGSGWRLWPLVGLVFAPPLVIVGAKRGRRALRRRQGTPAQRVVAAWRETRDRLRTHGLPSSAATSVPQLATRCRKEANEETALKVEQLGSILDVTLYAREEPSEHLAEAAWDAEEQIADALARGSGRLTRLRATFDPRPMVGGRR